MRQKQIENLTTAKKNTGLLESEICDPLDIQDYLDASGEASQRTRAISIVMIVASVLVFAALLNSMQSSWMKERIIIFNQGLGSKYVESKLGMSPKKEDFQDQNDFVSAKSNYEQKYRDFNSSLIRAYIENSMIVRVPFFGFSFDVNDLGLLSGIGFLIILSCFRFCITREVENLRLSFVESQRLGRLNEFYHLLAMKQVFTVPKTEYITRTRFLRFAPKFIPAFPLIVYLLVTVNDIRTSWIGDALQRVRFQVLFSFEVITLILLMILTVMVIQRMLRLDDIWEENAPSMNTTNVL